MNDGACSSFIPLREQPSSSIQMHTQNIELTSAIDADKIRYKFGIEVDGNHVPPPIEQFQEMGIPLRYLNFLKSSKNIKNPTPIQMQAVSCLMKDRDIISLSATGSGKTYAYLLPMLHLLNENRPTCQSANQKFDTVHSAPLCLLLVPSRELMNQVFGILTELLAIGENGKISSSTCMQNQYFSSNNNSSLPSGDGNLTPAVHRFGAFAPKTPESTFSKDKCVVGLCGGVPIHENVSNLNSSTKVVVATPGRLIDLCDRNNLSLSQIRYFVIDECDKLLEMGLEEQLRTIVAMVTVHNRPVQTSLWSATLPESLERIARSAVVDPIYICTGIKDTVTSNIEQKVIFMHTYRKEKLLLDVIRETPYPPVIIFVHSKLKADEVAELLQREQFHAAAIHSDKEQSYRNDVMASFKGDELDILVATDLISRGMDIPAVTHVVNFDTPNTIEDYLHRCGRTGRFGRHGIATTFLTLDCRIAKELKEMLLSTKSEIPIELLDTSKFGKKVLKTDMGDRVVS